MSEVKTYRVYATVLVNAYFDIAASSAEEAIETLPTIEPNPDYVSDTDVGLQNVQGAVELDDAFGTTYEENVTEIARLKTWASKLAEEDARFSRDEEAHAANESQDADT
jgi:hypothetical protein